MKLSWNEITNRAIKFSRDWADARGEKSQAQLFLNDFFHVFGVDLKRVALFEKKVPMGQNRDGYIDCLWSGVILVEMKSRGKSLKRAYEQAKDYAFNLSDAELPEYIMVCDFENIRLYRLTTEQVWTFKVSNLKNHVRKFALLAGYKSLRETYQPEIEVNEKAVQKMAKLHDALKESGYDGHALEVYLIRLLYCMFADDSNIFERGAFYQYIKNSKEDGSDLSRRLAELFEVLDMNGEKRLKNRLLPEKMKSDFPYINGKLFAEPLPVAYFDGAMRKLIIECCKMDWSKISPAIFGAMFQEVTDQKKRRELGAHYTSEENILKVIKPLFLDELREEFELIKHDKKKLSDFRDKLAKLQFLDPACGCGNFLIVMYLELIKLEAKIIEILIKNGLSVDFKVNLGQFYGIEIDPVACQNSKENMKAINSQITEQYKAALPDFAKNRPNSEPCVVAANALRIDWNEVISKDKLNYIIGNPPFVGYHMRTPEQREDMDLVFGKNFKRHGILDYVAAWFKKASDYMKGTQIEAAFVSTNSISQGQQPAVLWAPLIENNNAEINFAYRPFKWTNEKNGKKAQVHCVIIGFSDYKNGKKKKIFMGEGEK